MKKLVVDLDYVICINEIIESLNEFFGSDYTKDNFPTYRFEDTYKDEEKIHEFKKLHENSNFYKNPTLLTDAKKVLKQLSKYYEVFICTAFYWTGYPENSKSEVISKFDFILKTFDFINPKNIIFASNKTVIAADIMIDDNFENLKNNSKVKLLYNSLYNKDIPNNILEKENITRVNNWQEVKNLLMKIK